MSVSADRDPLSLSLTSPNPSLSILTTFKSDDDDDKLSAVSQSVSVVPTSPQLSHHPTHTDNASLTRNTRKIDEQPSTTTNSLLLIPNYKHLSRPHHLLLRPVCSTSTSTSTRNSFLQDAWSISIAMMTPSKHPQHDDSPALLILDLLLFHL